MPLTIKDETPQTTTLSSSTSHSYSVDLFPRDPSTSDLEPTILKEQSQDKTRILHRSERRNGPKSVDTIWRIISQLISTESFLLPRQPGTMKVAEAAFSRSRTE